MTTTPETTNAGFDLNVSTVAPAEQSAVLDDLAAELFDLDAQAVPAVDMTGSNTTTDCTDNGCSSTCPSVGCSQGC